MGRFKFQTSGNSLEDTPVFPFTLQGNSLKPLSPVNLTGARNANLDLVINWTRRSRTGAGLRPYTDVPLAEEQPLFEVEVYNGSTLKRTWRVTPHDSQPVIWSQIAKAETDVTITELTNGGIDYEDVSVSLGWGYALGAQRIYGDVRFEVELGAILFPTIVALVPIGINPDIASVRDTSPCWYHFSGTGTNLKAENLSSVQSYAEGDRFMIEITGGVIRYYKNRSQLMPPVYTSTRQLTGYPLRPVILFDSQTTASDILDQGVESAIIQQGATSAIYTREQQVADFGSTQSSVKVRVYQVSAVVGRGGFVEATI